MDKLKIRPSSECRWDAAAMGEIMLRFDPGEGRVRTARSFNVWEGGGEYNVMRGLKRCFGQRSTVITGIPENELGYLLEDLLFQGGVDISRAKWYPYDGMGLSARQGLNFVERGFGIRGAKGVSDRGHTAASALKPGDVDWRSLFGNEGVRWFHCGGIFAALSDTTAEISIEAMKAAKAAGTIVSYDLNYRPSLWQFRGGQPRAQEVNRRIAPLVDVMLGNEEDFSAALGIPVDDGNVNNLKIESYRRMMKRAVDVYPNFKAVAATLREVRTATLNDWRALLYCEGAFHESMGWANLEILDRVGGGDSFASGLIYGFLTGRQPQDCVNYGAAHGALAMTTSGDTSTASLAEVEKLVSGGGARVDR